jgi:hypothetical protein
VVKNQTVLPLKIFHSLKNFYGYHSLRITRIRIPQHKDNKEYLVEIYQVFSDPQLSQHKFCKKGRIYWQLA